MKYIRDNCEFIIIKYYHTTMLVFSDSYMKRAQNCTHPIGCECKKVCPTCNDGRQLSISHFVVHTIEMHILPNVESRFSRLESEIRSLYSYIRAFENAKERSDTEFRNQITAITLELRNMETTIITTEDSRINIYPTVPHWRIVWNTILQALLYICSVILIVLAVHQVILDE